MQGLVPKGPNPDLITVAEFTGHSGVVACILPCEVLAAAEQRRRLSSDASFSLTCCFIYDCLLKVVLVSARIAKAAQFNDRVAEAEA